MKNNKLKIQKILLTIAIIVTVFFAYQYWAKADISDNAQLVSVKKDGAISEVGKETLETLLKLRSLSLDGSLFKDEVFKNLTDFSLELESQPIGRNNPFAPIGAGGDYVSEKTDISESVNTPTDASAPANASPAPANADTPAPTGVPAL